MSFGNSWDFGGQGATDEFFMWSGHNVSISMSMFSGLKPQCTALNNITCSSTNIAGMCQVNYGAPVIDIGGFPIGVTVRDWKELPSE